MECAINELKKYFNAEVYDKEDGLVYMSVRNFGDWETPDDMMDEEDCDFEVPSEDTIKLVYYKMEEINEKCKNTKVSCSVSEKNYINFTIEKK